MRIRKRFPPSSPLSDPQLNRSPVVQQTSLQLHPNGNIRVQEAKNDSQPSDPPNQPPLRPLPSDQQTIIAAERSKRILISDHELKIKQKQGEKERCTEKQDQETDSNTPRKESILLGVPIAHTGSLPPVSTSHQVDERWYEGDKAIPLKKRRGSFLGRMRGETIMLEKEKKMKPKMKSKTNKKCSALPNSDEQDKEKESNKEIYSSAVKKMNKRGSVIMEGSRCSRVNGRGWRCCQQTLVGYSLCEHHLGKGRLRSITSVRSRAMGAPITTINTNTLIAPQPQHDIKFERLSSVSSSSLSLVQSAGQDDEEILLDDSYDDDDDHDDNDDDYDDDENKKKKPVLVRKKRMKLGMVKARSLSSLLNQTNNVVAVAAGNWNSSN